MHYGLYSLLQDWTGLDFKSIMNEAENIRNTVCNWTCSIFYIWSSACYYWCPDGTWHKCGTCLCTCFMCVLSTQSGARNQYVTLVEINFSVVLNVFSDQAMKEFSYFLAPFFRWLFLELSGFFFSNSKYIRFTQ